MGVRLSYRCWSVKRGGLEPGELPRLGQPWSRAWEAKFACQGHRGAKVAGEKLLMGLRRAAPQPPCNKRSSEPEPDSATPLPWQRQAARVSVLVQNVCPDKLVTWSRNSRCGPGSWVRAVRALAGSTGRRVRNRRVPATAFPRAPPSCSQVLSPKSWCRA